MRLACIRFAHISIPFKSIRRWSSSSVYCWMNNNSVDYWNEALSVSFFHDSSLSLTLPNWMAHQTVLNDFYRTSLASWLRNAPPLRLHYTDVASMCDFVCIVVVDCQQNYLNFPRTFVTSSFIITSQLSPPHITLILSYS